MRWIVVCGFCIGVLNMVAEDRGLAALLKARRQARAIEAGIAALRAENAALRARADALRHDPRAIELAAREQLGLTRPGEIVVFRPRP